MYRENYSQSTRKKHQPNSKCSQKTIDGQTQFALQTHDKISTKFALQTRQNYRQIYRQNSHDEESRQSSTCKYNATIQRKYRLKSPCKCNAIDNARQSDRAMVNATLITQQQNSQLFRYQTSPFQLSRATIPQKSKRVNSKEII